MVFLLRVGGQTFPEIHLDTRRGPRPDTGVPGEPENQDVCGGELVGK